MFDIESKATFVKNPENPDSELTESGPYSRVGVTVAGLKNILGAMSCVETVDIVNRVLLLNNCRITDIVAPKARFRRVPKQNVGT